VIETAGTRRILLEYPGQSIWNPRYDGQGHILFERDGTSNRGIWALPYDEGTGLAAGDPILIVPDAERPSVSRDGLMVYARNFISGGQEQMVWVDRTGEVLENITPVLPNVGGPALSPDERQIAMVINEDQEFDIWVHDLRRGTRQRLPNPGVLDVLVQWTPEGDRIFFYGMPPAHLIMSRTLDATAPVATVVAGSFPNLSVDGHWLAYTDYGSGHPQIYLVPADGSEEGRPIFTGPDSYEDPHISPDGRLFSYVSDETGRNELYIRSFPDGGFPVRVSLDGCERSKWSQDGRHLYFINSDTFYEVSVGTEARPDLGQPVALFTEMDNDLRFDRGFDVSDDGDQFVFPKLATHEVSNVSAELVAVDNWRRMLTGK